MASNTEYLDIMNKIAEASKKEDFSMDNIINRLRSVKDESNAYRDLLGGAAGKLYLDNTGVSIPNMKTASRNEIEKFTRDLLEENYKGELGNFDVRAIKGDYNGLYDPNLNRISINPDVVRNKSAQEVAETILHEGGHVLDEKSGLYIPYDKLLDSGEVSKDRLDSLKQLGVDNLKQKNKIPLDTFGEIMNDSHHLKIPGRMKSFSRSALENLAKGMNVKSLALPALIGAGAAAYSGDSSAAVEGAVDAVTPMILESEKAGPKKDSPEYKLESNLPLSSEDMDTLNYDDSQRDSEIDRQLRNHSVFKDEVKNTPNNIDRLKSLRNLQ